MIDGKQLVIKQLATLVSSNQCRLSQLEISWDGQNQIEISS